MTPPPGERAQKIGSNKGVFTFRKFQEHGEKLSDVCEKVKKVLKNPQKC